MLDNRTGTFTPTYFSTPPRQSLEKGNSYPVRVHGAFQYQDEDGAETLILIELESGVLIEATSREVVMDVGI